MGLVARVVFYTGVPGDKSLIINENLLMARRSVVSNDVWVQLPHSVELLVLQRR
ncbi:hypothetical protein Hanom_Chr15g01371821 [Helianthus anomalus]